jgi:hypothetical protein
MDMLILELEKRNSLYLQRVAFKVGRFITNMKEFVRFKAILRSLRDSSVLKVVISDEKPIGAEQDWCALENEKYKVLIVGLTADILKDIIRVFVERQADDDLFAYTVLDRASKVIVFRKGSNDWEELFRFGKE